MSSSENVSFPVDLANNHRKRREVLTEIVTLCEDEQSLAFLIWSKTPPATQNDLYWMIDCLQSADKELQARWAILIHIMLRSNLTNYKYLDAVFYASEQNPILAQKVAHTYAPIVINSEEAQEMRASHFKWKALEERRQNRPKIEPSPSERVTLLLGKCESGDYAAWWQLNRELTLEPDGEGYHDELEADLTQLPGWQNADDVTRQRIIEAAKQYVLYGNPQTDQWLGTNKIYFPAFAGYRALLLLFHHMPDFISTLTDEIWKRWAAIVVAYPITFGSEEEKQHEGLIQLVYHFAPSEMIDTLMILIDRENVIHERVFIIRKFNRCGDAQLVQALLDKVEKDLDSLKPNTLDVLLEYLLERDDGRSDLSP